VTASGRDEALHGLLTIMHLTWTEARRMRITLASLICALLLLAVFGTAVYFMHLLGPGAIARPAFIRHAQLEALTLAGLYVANFLTLAFAVLLPVDSISGEIESGVIQTIASKPVSRSTIVLGKWLAFLVMVAGYLLLVTLGVVLLVRLFTGFVPPHLATALPLLLLGAATLSGGGGASGQQQPADVFEPVTLSAAALEALRTLAWRHGTYYGPGFPRGGTVSDGGTTWPGRVTFDAANPMPDGVIFVDTTDGRDVVAGGSASLAEARFDAGAFGARAEGFRGWIIVNGSIEIAAGLNVRGLVYAVDALTYQASDPSRIEGLAISLNVRGAASSRIEAAGAADVAIRFDCGHAAAPGLVPHGFLPIPGTYREDDD